MSSGHEFHKYKWHNSYSIPVEVQVGVTRLEIASSDFEATQSLLGESARPTEGISISAQIICNNVVAHESPVCTYTAMEDSYRKALVWDYVMLFPLKIRDLPFDSIVAFTAKTQSGKTVGSTSMRFYDANGMLKRGKQKLFFYMGVEADRTSITDCNTTPGEVYEQKYAKYDQQFKTEKLLESFKSEKHAISAREDKEGGSRTEWLDKLTYAQLQLSIGHNNNSTDLSDYKSTNSSSSNNNSSNIQQQDSYSDDADLRENCYLIIDLPNFNTPVIYEEFACRYSFAPSLHVPPTNLLQMADKMRNELVSLDSSVLEFNLGQNGLYQSSLVVIADWEADLALENNIFEDMYKKSNQNTMGRGNFDPFAKPNLHEKEMIDRIIKSSTHKVVQYEEMELLYRFRYTLTENPKALVKFLYAINWDSETEVAELPQLLAMWKDKAPIEVTDALKLLGKGQQFQHSFVRTYAVEILSKSCNDDDLLTYLLQLVQALRYEPAVSDGASEESSKKVPGTDINSGDSKAAAATESSGPPPMSNGSSRLLSPLANFIINRACKSASVANFLYWYLRVEFSDSTAEGSSLYLEIYEAFLLKLSSSGEVGATTLKQLEAQSDYMMKLMSCLDQGRKEGKRKEEKQSVMKRLMVEKNLAQIPAKGIGQVPLPLDPSVMLTGCNPERTFMFSSAIYPTVIEFNQAPAAASMSSVVSAGGGAGGDGEKSESTGTRGSGFSSSGGGGVLSSVEEAKKIRMIFKKGDDMRQDQLIMQMFQLMDILLKRVNLDLKLVTYKILALSNNEGVMEFVSDSQAISAVNKDYKENIQAFLLQHNPDPNGPYGISSECMDLYVKSCAGCCVMTYILGIGDRHLDNVMIKKNGQMFHIDFGWILGNDPKPMPAAFRLTRNMVDAMGGEESEHFSKFKSLCYQAFNWLRKSANLILNLMSLMGDAGLSQLRRQDLEKTLWFVENRFHLEKTDEEAEHYFLFLINQSMNAIVPKVTEALHKVAVWFR